MSDTHWEIVKREGLKLTLKRTDLTEKVSKNNFEKRKFEKQLNITKINI